MEAEIKRGDRRGRNMGDEGDPSPSNRKRRLNRKI